jgi:hypothetical protein
MEEKARRNSLIIFWIEEINGERYESTQKIIEQLVKKKLPEIHGHVDYVKQLGRGRGSRPILVKLMTFSKKLDSTQKHKKASRKKN